MHQQAENANTEAPVFIHGPQGCGKTRNSAALAKHYGKSFVIDHTGKIPADQYPPDALVFTHHEGELTGSIAFDDAMRAAGLASSASAATLMLLRVHVRGLEIDAQCREGGVVNLIVRTNQHQCGLIGHIAQHIAHALYRIADIFHPCKYDRRGIRVVELMVRDDTAGNLHSDGGDHHIVQRWPGKLPNGDTHYDTLVVYEGVKSHQYGFLPDLFIKGGRQKSADYSHVNLPKNKVVVWEDDTCVAASAPLLGRGK